jgi:hypothetical protein
MSITQEQKKVINPYQDKEFLERAFVRLAQIRREIQNLQREEELIKDWAQYYAFEFLLKDEKNATFLIDGVKTTISIAFKRVFEYPEEIRKLEEELKNKKKQAELNGTAKVISINRYLVFKF